MLPLIIAVIFIVALGKKIHTSKLRIAIWIVVTIIASLFSHSAAVCVLLVLFVSAPFMLHLKSVDAKQSLFSVCVVFACTISIFHLHPF